MIALTLEERKNLKGLLRSAIDSEAVVLVGSAARGERTSSISDVDVLVVGDRVPFVSPVVQATFISLDDLRRRASSGDDFVQWALRFGVAFTGVRRWRRLKAELRQAPWPDPDVNRSRARDRLRTGRELLEMGDVEAAGEEALLAASHVARADLLSHQVFPLSRPELVKQLRANGLEGVAMLLQRASNPELDAKGVERLFDAIEAALAAR